MVCAMHEIVLTAPSGDRVASRETLWWLVPAFAFLLITDALEAWQIGPIPIQWLSKTGSVAIAIWLVGAGRLFFAPGSVLFIAFVAWAAAVTTWFAVFSAIPHPMPAMATTPFPVFVALRFLNLFAFFAIAQITYTLLKAGKQDQIVKVVILLGVLVAATGIYLYVAQTLGLPQPPRNRAGTSGGEQVTTFSYAFNRALGTFREPSHLAEWLTLPLFLCFADRRRARTTEAVVIAAALLLTGSLTGIVGAGMGLAAALVVTNPFGANKLRILTRVLAITLVGLWVFQQTVASNLPGSVSLVDVLSGRLSPILEGGLAESNRFYIYNFLRDTPAPFWGAGLGAANLEVSAYLNSDLVTSFLSVYFNTLYATGAVGMTMLAIFLGLPLVRLWIEARTRLDDRYTYMTAAAYCTWLIVFAVRAEELAPTFGVAYAMLVFIGTRDPRHASARKPE